MIYEFPLAYLLGLEGVALMRGFIGDTTGYRVWSATYDGRNSAPPWYRPRSPSGCSPPKAHPVARARQGHRLGG